MHRSRKRVICRRGEDLSRTDWDTAATGGTETERRAEEDRGGQSARRRAIRAWTGGEGTGTDGVQDFHGCLEGAR